MYTYNYLTKYIYIYTYINIVVNFSARGVASQKITICHRRPVVSK
jgi:hypothetical protein